MTWDYAPNLSIINPLIPEKALVKLDLMQKIGQTPVVFGNLIQWFRFRDTNAR